MREIFNEGRIVGLSQWEIYVRHFLSKNPTGTPLNEQEWLSASLASNISMILRIPAGTQRGIHDYKLPVGSDLCGCSTIYGTVFEGAVSLDESGHWATRVDDYGRFIRNDIEVNPQTPGEPEDVPVKDGAVDVPDEFKEMCKEYLKISGGVIIQPGDWLYNTYWEPIENENGEPVVTPDFEEFILAPVSAFIAAKTLDPDMARTGFVRLAITGELTTDVLILLHGFSYKALVTGEVGYAYVPDVGKPEDGGFLGPARFPWGCQIAFLITNEVMKALMSGDDPPIGPPIPEWVNEWNPSWKPMEDPPE